MRRGWPMRALCVQPTDQVRTSRNIVVSSKKVFSGRLAGELHEARCC